MYVCMYTSMVNVFPLDVWPYAKIVPLYPLSTSTPHHLTHTYMHTNMQHTDTLDDGLGCILIHLILGGLSAEHAVEGEGGLALAL